MRGVLLRACVEEYEWVHRARTNFNPLELVGGLPGEAQTVLDAAAAGQSERSNSGRGRGGGGAISQAVASALVEHPAASDSSTREGLWRSTPLVPPPTQQSHLT